MQHELKQLNQLNQQRSRSLPSLAAPEQALWAMGWPSEPSANPWRESRYRPQPRKFAPSTAGWDHASPLEAIHDRDINEMGGWFERDDMVDVEDDIQRLLVMLFPEPAWDDEAWSFLRDYL
jgi:hypothetical protein